MENQQKNKLPNFKPSKGPKFNIFWMYGIIIAVIIGLNIWNGGVGGNSVEYTFQIFKTQFLDSNKVDKIYVYNKSEVEVHTKKGYKPAIINFEIGSVEQFEKMLDAAQANKSEQEKITPIFAERGNLLRSIGEFIIPALLMIGLFVLFMRKMGGGAQGGGAGGIFNIGKSKAQLFEKGTKVNITFNDVAGLDEAKVEVMEIVDFLKNPKKYTELGAKIPKGALLVGPPGTGKTLLAKAVAGEAKVPFFSLSGSDFVEMFVGVGASRVRDLFRQAKEKAPSIIFIDEIDAIGRARGKNNGFNSNDERENTLNQLLTEMDGFGTNSGVIILAATNRADVLDSALMRAGRFDRQIYVDMPDLNERKEIFQVHLKPLKLSEGLDIDFLAKQTPGFSGADIANLCNEAALIAARHDKKHVEKQDFLDAVDRIIGGLEKKNKIITKEEKKAIAFHEAGHATISWLLQYAHPLVKVTIVPRGQSLGAAWYLPEERSITTTEQILDQMCTTLGGRAAEQLTFGKISTGALSDLEKVTKQAYAMVSIYGLNERLGNISFYDSQGRDSFTKPYSEDTARMIDEEVSKLIESQYQRALQVLSEHQDKLNALAEQLLTTEVIFKEDLERIFGKRQWEAEELVEAPAAEVQEAVVVQEELPREEVKEASESTEIKTDEEGNDSPIDETPVSE